VAVVGHGDAAQVEEVLAGAALKRAAADEVDVLEVNEDRNALGQRPHRGRGAAGGLCRYGQNIPDMLPIYQDWLMIVFWYA